MVCLTIHVPAVPVAQPRVKAANHGGHTSVYTPTTVTKSDGTKAPHPSVLFKAQVRHELSLQFGGSPLTGPLRISGEFVFPRTKELLKKKYSIERIRHTVKPDRDNLDKAVLDALKGLLFVDDCQACTGMINKWYAAIGEAAHCNIYVKQLGPGE